LKYNESLRVHEFLQLAIEDEPQFELPSEELTSNVYYGPLNASGK
jgi:hypothetical protein